MEINNRTVRIIQIPKTYPSREMWMMSEENFDLQLKENEFIVKNEFIFLDDRTLEYLNKESSKILDKVMFAITFGKVLESKNINYVKNDVVIGDGGVWPRQRWSSSPAISSPSAVKGMGSHGRLVSVTRMGTTPSLPSP